jgi:hypothetical protein
MIFAWLGKAQATLRLRSGQWFALLSPSQKLHAVIFAWLGKAQASLALLSPSQKFDGASPHTPIKKTKNQISKIKTPTLYFN